ncbi:flagellar hook-length control protein FliK [Aquabacter sp. L1I39]|uniref:flagellar hook-length control protein FliK n=1 Tax=Aquabacter sp. L1I39 TaxID=2820278 RepID=UPI001AD98DE9|nr:flagellar hook-length control protein FliK [Aquabacter sp. L1I39]QTL04333.1 flagellar hook-length control protein FliK [Aquabacter sp. L1I39]
MMPLDARFTTLPIPANDTRPPDEGDGARAGNPFSGLLDEMGRGAGGQSPTDQRPTEEAGGAAQAAPGSPAAPAEPAEGGTDLSRLIARALTRSGGMAQEVARPAMAPLPTAARALQAEAGAAADAGRMSLDLERLSPSCALGASPLADVAEPGDTGLDRTDAPGMDAAEDRSGTDAAGSAAAGWDATGTVAQMVCLAPPSAGRTGGTSPHDPAPDPHAGAPHAGAAPQDAQEDITQDAPRLVAKVLDVQTHFAPIRSLVSTSAPAAAPPATAGADTARIIPAVETRGGARPLAAGPGLSGTDGFPSLASRPADAPANAPAQRAEMGAEPFSAPTRTPDVATGGTAQPNPAAAPAAPIRAPVVTAPPQPAPATSDVLHTGQSPAATDADTAVLAALSTPDRPARRAEPAAASTSGSVKAPEATPGTTPFEPSPVARAGGERSSSRDERRDERAASVPIETGAGRGAAGSAAPTGTPMPSAAPPATAAVAVAISEAASRLVRTNAGIDLTAPPRPGDPVRIMEIALSPEGLGKVTVRLRLTSDGLEVRVRASDAGTAALLQQDKAQLAGILREFGCSEDRMEVSGPDGSAIGSGAGPDLRSTQASPGDDRRGDPQGDRQQGGSQDGSRRNEGRHDDQGSRNPGRGGARDAGFDLRLDGGLDGGLLDG